MEEERKKYYVYVDRTDEGIPFYVGKGNDARCATFDRNDRHSEIMRRCGLNRRIDGPMLEHEAFDRERSLIAELRLNYHRHPDNPYACNGTDGGDGISGHRHTDETKQRMSSSAKGKLKSRDHVEKMRRGILEWHKSADNRDSFMEAIRSRDQSFFDDPAYKAIISAVHLGRKRSEITKQNISASLRAREDEFSEERKARIAEQLLGNKNARRRRVAQLDENGAIVRVFSSMAEASRQFGHNNSRCIIDVCKGRTETAYGYRWVYAED